MKFREIEAKWQKYWDEHPELYRASIKKNKEKKYILNEFPYPSGSGLHIGHAFSFTGSDVYARFKRMQGYQVMFPMGWDAFGLPTENYAIKNKRKPQEVTAENTAAFKKQMKRLAFSFDWEREIDTTDPNYYRWTQWIFIKLFEKGLAYKKEMPINWCPSCKIGLANEEVVNGKCERCGHEAERRNISQWIVKITDYADRLLSGLEETDFENKVKLAQINWIGKSEGARIKFKIEGRDEEVEVFTTRADTLPGASFLTVAPEHLLAVEAAKNNQEVADYIKKTEHKSDLERTELNKEKTGVFSGFWAINPYNQQKIPVWVSDFVLASYGTGAIMSVPAHDQRDHDFAVKFGLPIIPVIKKKGWNFDKEAYVSEERGKEIKIGQKCNQYHLRDWIFSRQHYWGEPIPMIDCPKCGWVTVPEEELPLRLPEVEAYEPTADGQSPLSKIESFVNCRCPKCGGPAKRETDTMPNWAGSDWYYLAYCLFEDINKPLPGKENIFVKNKEILSEWMPVDVYIGGDEHNTLHLLYSRFIYQFLHDLGVMPAHIREPYDKRVSHGVILGPDGFRMSKSRGNVVVPESVADKYGVDVLRLYLMFMGPFESVMAWNEKTLIGVKRFLDRLTIFVEKQKDNKESSERSLRLLNKTIEGVTQDLENFGFNTVVAKLMEAINKIDKLSREDLKKLIKLIAPLAPYTAEELWHKLGEKESVHGSDWPEYDQKMDDNEVIKVPVAVNGKVRDQLEVDQEESQNASKMISRALELDKIKTWVEGKEIVKEIYVPGKMLNLVVR